MSSLEGTTGLTVLGMHRSGTSALSGLLVACGFNMGKELFGPQEGVNERGFFENSGVVAINESLLDRLCHQWDSPLPLWSYESLLDEDTRNILERFLVRQYQSSTLWGMKDPRTSILEPLWSSAVKRLGARYHCVLIFRDPFKVADSLARRDRFSAEKSLMLWMNYNLNSLETVTRESSAIIDFEDLISSPAKTVGGMFDKFGLPPVEPQVIDGFIEQSMNRSKRLRTAPETLTSLAEMLYEELRGDVLSIAAVAEIKARYYDYARGLSPALTEHIVRVSGSEVHYRTLFYEAYDSWWWKASTPLRWLERTLRSRHATPPPPRY